MIFNPSVLETIEGFKPKRDNIDPYYQGNVVSESKTNNSAFSNATSSNPSYKFKDNVNFNQFVINTEPKTKIEINDLHSALIDIRTVLASMFEQDTITAKNHLEAISQLTRINQLSAKALDFSGKQQTTTNIEIANITREGVKEQITVSKMATMMLEQRYHKFIDKFVAKHTSEYNHLAELQTERLEAFSKRVNMSVASIRSFTNPASRILSQYRESTADVLTVVLLSNIYDVTRLFALEYKAHASNNTIDDLTNSLTKALSFTTLDVIGTELKRFYYNVLSPIAITVSAVEGMYNLLTKTVIGGTYKWLKDYFTGEKKKQLILEKYKNNKRPEVTTAEAVSQLPDLMEQQRLILTQILETEQNIFSALSSLTGTKYKTYQDSDKQEKRVYVRELGEFLNEVEYKEYQSELKSNVRSDLSKSYNPLHWWLTSESKMDLIASDIMDELNKRNRFGLDRQNQFSNLLNNEFRDSGEISDPLSLTGSRPGLSRLLQVDFRKLIVSIKSEFSDFKSFYITRQNVLRSHLTDLFDTNFNNLISTNTTGFDILDYDLEAIRKENVSNASNINTQSVINTSKIINKLDTINTTIITKINELIAVSGTSSAGSPIIVPVPIGSLGDLIDYNKLQTIIDTAGQKLDQYISNLGNNIKRFSVDGINHISDNLEKIFISSVAANDEIYELHNTVKRIHNKIQPFSPELTINDNRSERLTFSNPPRLAAATGGPIPPLSDPSNRNGPILVTELGNEIVLPQQFHDGFVLNHQSTIEILKLLREGIHPGFANILDPDSLSDILSNSLRHVLETTPILLTDDIRDTFGNFNNLLEDQLYLDTSERLNLLNQDQQSPINNLSGTPDLSGLDININEVNDAEQKKGFFGKLLAGLGLMAGLKGMFGLIFKTFGTSIGSWISRVGIGTILKRSIFAPIFFALEGAFKEWKKGGSITDILIGGFKTMTTSDTVLGNAVKYAMYGIPFGPPGMLAGFLIGGAIQLLVDGINKYSFSDFGLWFKDKYDAIINSIKDSFNNLFDEITVAKIEVAHALNPTSMGFAVENQNQLNKFLENRNAIGVQGININKKGQIAFNIDGDNFYVNKENASNFTNVSITDKDSFKWFVDNYRLGFENLTRQLTTNTYQFNLDGLTFNIPSEWVEELETQIMENTGKGIRQSTDNYLNNRSKDQLKRYHDPSSISSGTMVRPSDVPNVKKTGDVLISSQSDVPQIVTDLPLIPQKMTFMSSKVGLTRDNLRLDNPLVPSSIEDNVAMQVPFKEQGMLARMFGDEPEPVVLPKIDTNYGFEFVKELVEHQESAYDPATNTVKSAPVKQPEKSSWVDDIGTFFKDIIPNAKADISSGLTTTNSNALAFDTLLNGPSTIVPYTAKQAESMFGLLNTATSTDKRLQQAKSAIERTQAEFVGLTESALNAGIGQFNDLLGETSQYRLNPVVIDPTILDSLNEAVRDTIRGTTSAFTTAKTEVEEFAKSFPKTQMEFIETTESTLNSGIERFNGLIGETSQFQLNPVSIDPNLLAPVNTALSDIRNLTQEDVVLGSQNVANLGIDLWNQHVDKNNQIQPVIVEDPTAFRQYTRPVTTAVSNIVDAVPTSNQEIIDLKEDIIKPIKSSIDGTASDAFGQLLMLNGVQTTPAAFETSMNALNSLSNIDTVLQNIPKSIQSGFNITKEAITSTALNWGTVGPLDQNQQQLVDDEYARLLERQRASIVDKSNKPLTQDDIDSQMAKYRQEVLQGGIGSYVSPSTTYDVANTTRKATLKAEDVVMRDNPVNRLASFEQASQSMMDMFGRHPIEALNRQNTIQLVNDIPFEANVINDFINGPSLFDQFARSPSSLTANFTQDPMGLNTDNTVPYSPNGSSLRSASSLLAMYAGRIPPELMTAMMVGHLYDIQRDKRIEELDEKKENEDIKLLDSIFGPVKDAISIVGGIATDPTLLIKEKGSSLNRAIQNSGRDSLKQSLHNFYKKEYDPSGAVITGIQTAVTEAQQFTEKLNPETWFTPNENNNTNNNTPVTTPTVPVVNPSNVSLTSQQQYDIELRKLVEEYVSLKNQRLTPNIDEFKTKINELKSNFQGAMATGGRLLKDQTAIVGEIGPELLVSEFGKAISLVKSPVFIKANDRIDIIPLYKIDDSQTEVNELKAVWEIVKIIAKKSLGVGFDAATYSADAGDVYSDSPWLKYIETKISEVDTSKYNTIANNIDFNSPIEFPGSILPSDKFESIQMMAKGGPVESNTPYIIGEQGPEMFVPNVSGGILSNDALSKKLFNDDDIYRPVNVIIGVDDKFAISAKDIINNSKDSFKTTAISLLANVYEILRNGFGFSSYSVVSATSTGNGNNTNTQINPITGQPISSPDQIDDSPNPFIEKFSGLNSTISGMADRALSTLGNINLGGMTTKLGGFGFDSGGVGSSGGNTGAYTAVTGDKKTMMSNVYQSFINAGFSDAQAKALTAEVGRENDFNSKSIFGTHGDAANSKVNLGFFSWQGSRKTQLQRYLASKGLLDKNGQMVQSQEALNAMAEFARSEMQSGEYKVSEFLNNPNIDSESAAKILGKNYIKWAYGQNRLSSGKSFDWKQHDTKRAGYYNALSEVTGTSGVTGSTVSTGSTSSSSINNTEFGAITGVTGESGGGGLLATGKKYLGMQENKDRSSLSNMVGFDVTEKAWCGGFVGGVLKESGYSVPKGHASARSYLNYGQSVDLTNAKPGDIAVFNRGGGNKGHVGIIDRIEGDKIYLLGGNQGKTGVVSISGRSINKAGSELLGIRRPTANEIVDPEKAALAQSSGGINPESVGIAASQNNNGINQDLNQFATQQNTNVTGMSTIDSMATSAESQFSNALSAHLNGTGSSSGSASISNTPFGGILDNIGGLTNNIGSGNIMGALGNIKNIGSSFFSKPTSITPKLPINQFDESVPSIIDTANEWNSQSTNQLSSKLDNLIDVNNNSNSLLETQTQSINSNQSVASSTEITAPNSNPAPNAVAEYTPTTLDPYGDELMMKLFTLVPGQVFTNIKNQAIDNKQLNYFENV